MSRNERGFTLIELMIVIAIIAIIAAIAIPNLLAARLSANEDNAIAGLRTLTTAQAQMQHQARIDTDLDGTGEYGGLAELSGALQGRCNAVLTQPPLSGVFTQLNANGENSQKGYFFRVYLPDAAGAGVGEPQTGFTAAMLNADQCETTWCAYSWPANQGQSGNRTFFVNQRGDILFTETNAYSGTGAGPTHDAAFTTAGVITGPAAVGVAGNDANTWRTVQ